MIKYCFLFLVLILLFNECELKEDKFLCNGKALPSHLFDKYEYRTYDLIIPPPPNDTLIITNSILFKLSGQMENKNFKVIRKNNLKYDITKIQPNIESYKETIYSNISASDTICIYEMIGKDSISLFTTILESKEIEEKGKISILYPDPKKVGNFTPRLYFDLNWKIGGKFIFYNHSYNSVIPVGGTSLLKVDTINCLPIFQFLYSRHSNTAIKFYSPSIGYIKDEYDYTRTELTKINDILLSDYIKKKCKNYVPILEQLKKYDPYY